MAAAGIVALHEMVERLADDHAHARRLAQGLALIPGVTIRPEMVKTNMVFFGLEDDISPMADDVIASLRQRQNIWLGALDSRHFRAVLHHWIGEREVDLFMQTLAEILRQAQ